MFLQFSCMVPSKNHPKTLPKQGLNPSKIDAENVLIFNIDFLRFWPRFGRVLASKMEPSWLKNAKIEMRDAFFGCLKLSVF